jgi:hypothetical protein
MSHSTHVGFNWPLTGPWTSDPPRTTASVKLTPACALLPFRLREPDPVESPLVGVGQLARVAIVCKLARTAPVRPAAPPRFVP